MRRAAPILLAALFAVLSRHAAAQCEVQTLLASDGHAQDIFGKSVAVRGNRLLVGQTDLDPTHGGSVYAFRRTATGWTQVQRFTGGDTGPSDWFGYSAAMCGATAVVGATDHSHGGIAVCGGVYVFEVEQGTWREAQELTVPAAGSSDLFGVSVAIDGDVLAASAIGHDTGGLYNAGVVYVFERRPAGWIRTADLVPSDSAAGDNFGDDVAVSGSRIVAGKSRDQGFRGAAYIFEKTPGGWSQTAKLTASDAAPYANFGWSVDVEGDRALIGSVRADSGASAYVFERTPSGWVERAKLRRPESSADNHFGYAVALEADTAFVSAPSLSGPANPPGAVYVFRREGGGWPFVARLSAADDAPDNALGVELAVDGETLVAGAPWDGAAGSLAGAAEVFAIPEFATPYGHCPGAGICGNADPFAGCANSTGRGARLAARGSASLASDDFALAADRLPPGRRVLFFRGGAEARAPLGDGVRRVAAGVFGSIRCASGLSAADGTASLGPGFLGASGIAPGETWYFQAWYADPAGPCGSGSNASNAVRAVFRP